MTVLQLDGRRLNVCAALVMLVLGSSTSRAVYGQAELPAARVQGAGQASIERLPNILRVHVQLSARGKSLAEALAALKDRREAAKAVLPSLGAAPDSVSIDDPQVTRGEEQQKMNEMLMERMGRTKRSVKGVAAAIPTTATAMLTAEWPLKSSDIEQLLAEGLALEEKIKAADLGGLKEAQELTPEEEEMQAELQQAMGRNPYGEQATKEAQFSYVAKVSNDDRAKLTSEAFQKAKKEAERLAQAAGATIGKLSSLQSSTNADAGAVEGGYYGYDGEAYYYAMQQRQMAMSRGAAAPTTSDAESEAVGARPAKVRYAVRVTAVFGLE